MLPGRQSDAIHLGRSGSVKTGLVASSLCRGGFWDQDFAESVKFTGDPIVATPDVTEIAVKEEDEFIILASDGLWYAILLLRLQA